jgi:hypothetical protein
MVARINIFCSAEEEFIKSLERVWSRWINYASKPDSHREPLRSRGWDQLKMVRERLHPIRNQVVLGEPDVRVTTREGLGDIAVSYSEPAGKVLRRLVIGGSPNSTGRSFRGGAILSRHSRSAVRSPSFAKMGRIATGIDLFRHGATAVKAGHLSRQASVQLSPQRCDRLGCSESANAPTDKGSG